MRKPLGIRLTEITSHFHRDARGVSLIYVTVALPVLIAFGLLAVDVGRLFSLQSSLQNGSDALALAGAGELDRRADAITRANRAVDNLITTTNTSVFATSVVEIRGSSIARHYLDAIPAADTTPIDTTWLTAHETSNPATARYLQVIVNPATFNTIFPATWLGVSSNSTTVTANAVAGMDQAVCSFTPLFMCNPYEPTSGTTDPLLDYGLYAATTSTADKRRIIALKAHDNASQWSPGNYGFLEPDAGPGAHTLGESIAAVTPQACFRLKGLNTQTGNMTSLKNAFNTRFDIYRGSFGNASDKTNYPPAANVRKGYIVKRTSGNGAANACDHNNPIEAFFGRSPPATYDDAMGFPSDSVIGANRLGNGDWGGDTVGSAAVPDFEQYWNTNFGSISRPTDSTGTVYSNTNLPTRYSIYRYEIANSLVATPSYGYHTTSPTANAQEVGTPACNAGAGIDNPDRRIIYGAIINCRAVSMSGGSGGPYTAVAFGKFFMTAPMGDPPDSVLSTELVDVVQPGQANSVARDMVQLYR